METDRLREALAWAVGFIRCQHPNAERDYEDMRNAVSLASGSVGMFGEFHRLSCRAEVAETYVDEMLALLKSIRQWDQLPHTGDGPYWIGRIDRLVTKIENKDYPIFESHNAPESQEA